jgi:hypothetical protein
MFTDNNGVPGDSITAYTMVDVLLLSLAFDWLTPQLCAALDRAVHQVGKSWSAETSYRPLVLSKAT